MTPRHRLGDRREDVRFEIAGNLWGALEFREDVVVRNIGQGGMMTEATPTFALASARVAEISLKRSRKELTAIVRHVSPVSNEGGTGRCLVGLEFANISPSERLEIEQLLAE